MVETAHRLGGSPSTVRTPRPLQHFRALDGIRAVAVIGVLLYHFGVPHSSGGFLGVDLFFVLSGYLITGQLMTRWVFGPHIGLREFGQFWGARARRLFPSLAVVLAATTGVVAIADRVQLSVFRGDLAAAATYTSNWWYVFHHRSYFVASGRPPLLQHLWSLAVEEQFYLVWPVVIALVALVVRRRWARKGALLVVAVGLAVTSALVMGLGSSLAQVPQLGDPSRWYFGSDSHAVGLLVGSILAIARGGDGLGGRRHTPMGRAHPWSTVTGFVALAVVLAFLSRVGEYSAWLYRFGFVVFSVTAAVIIAVAVQRGPLERLLGNPLLTAIGRRSYSMYLWHWPVACMTRPGLDIAWPQWQVFLLRVGITLALTEATYRFVECPIRAHGWRLVWRRIRAVHVGRVRGPVLLGGLGAVLVASICTPAGVAAPHQASYDAGGVYVRCTTGTDGRPQVPADAPAGARCAPAATPGPAVTSTTTPASSVPPSTGTPRPSPTHRATTRPQPSGTAASPSSRPTTSPPAPTTHQAAPPPPHGVEQLSSLPLVVYGDSVPLGAVPELTGEFASVTNHATEGEQSWDLLPELTADAQAGRLDGAVVLLHTGDNGLISESQLRTAMAALHGARRVVVATPHTPRQWEQPAVAVLRKVVPDYPNARLMDWNAAVADQSSWLWSDGIHLTPSGGQAYAHLVARAAVEK